MSDKMRWRYGDTNDVEEAAVDAETVIERGDLLWQDIDDAKPAALFDDYGIVTQSRFADHFLGVAMWWSREGDTDPICVATTGVFEFDCPSSTFELGDLIGPAMSCLTQILDDNPGSCWEVLCNQKVAKVDSTTYAIGRVAKRVPEAANTVLVDIRSTVMTGGVCERRRQVHRGRLR